MQQANTNNQSRNVREPSRQSPSPHLPNTGFVRLNGVLRHIPVSKSTWWEGVKTGIYPKPVKIGPRMTAWRVEDIHALIARFSGNDGGSHAV